MNVSSISILDLAQIPQGGNAQTALHRTRELAQHAERLGFHRFWLAEHHNMAGIASAATSVAIGFVAEGTSTIRVGAGGVMLPNHAPLVIAEQFGTLEALYPGRIDLGLGRAPGTDQVTMRALRRDFTSADTFPTDVQELQALLDEPMPGQQIHAVPGTGRRSRCGSSARACSARSSRPRSGCRTRSLRTSRPTRWCRAAGLPRQLPAVAATAEPHVMLAANVIVADTDDEARRLFTSMQRSFIDGAFRRTRTLLPPPMDSIDDYWQPHEKAQLEGMLAAPSSARPRRCAPALTPSSPSTRPTS